MQTRERIYHNMLFNYFKSIFKDNLYRQAKKARSTKKILSGIQLFLPVTSTESLHIRFKPIYFRSLAEERDSYFSKLKDIEDELRVIEEQTKNSSLFFGMTSQKFCQRLNKILTSEACECHQECQCHQTCQCQQKCQCH